MKQENESQFPKVACAILSYNHPEITSRATSSVLKFHPNSDSYLIHNGSEQKWILQHQNNFPSIKHLCIEENKGFTGGVNFTFTELFKTYDWVFLITNDCTLISPLHSPSEVGIYSPLIYRRKLETIDSICGLFWPSAGKLRHARTIEDLKKYNFNYKFKRKPKLYVPGTAFWLHKDVFSKIGLFDESLHTYWEDVDYSQRVLKAGLKVSPYIDTKLIHAVGKTCHKDTFYTKHLFHRNRKIVSLRYCRNLFEKLILICTLIFEKLKRFNKHKYSMFCKLL